MTEDLLKVYSVRSVPGHREFYPHHHNELELAYFRSGSGIYSVTGREYPIAPGDIFLFSSSEIHKITYVDPSCEMEALNFHFLPRLLLTENGGVDLPLVFFGRRDGSNRITPELAGSCYPDICSALSDCESEMREKLEGYLLLARQDLFRALVLIMRSCNLIGESKRRTGSVDGIARALDYIDSNYLGEITIAGLCGIARMSRSNFERLFVMMTGVPVLEYVKRRRIDHAAELLRSTDQTVLDAALASGYHNTANFNKQFKQVMGITPIQYRKKVNVNGE